MADQKVIIFGSFTEDENRLHQNKSVEKEPAPPLEKSGFKTGSPLGHIELQFGSLDVTSLDAIKGLGAELKKPASYTKSQSRQESSPVAQEKKTHEKLPVDCSLQKGKVAESNGLSNGCHKDVTGDEETVELNSVPICANGDTTLNQTSLSIIDGVSETSAKFTGIPPSVKSLLPRGLINPGNLCFLNATLQALLSCSPFVQLLQDLANKKLPKMVYPVLQAFIEFISDFEMPENPCSDKQEKGVIGTGMPFSPVMFDTVLKVFTPDVPISSHGRPRQEDAQEFLSFVMDRLHDELLKLKGNLSNSDTGRLPLVSSSEEDGWETVGPKNKSAVTRTQSFAPSELSAIFGGELRSVVKARGSKASATVQPFLLLHLDILPETVHTIEDALLLFSTPETVEGYRASAGKAGVVSASKSVKIETLSKVLILHLMRFSYGSRGSSKLHKPVRFPLELVLARDLLVTQTSEGRKYELVATITHHGQEPYKGHYTADAKNTCGQWLRYDDSSVIPVGTNKVLHAHAYVLFYKQV